MLFCFVCFSINFAFFDIAVFDSLNSFLDGCTYSHRISLWFLTFTFSPRYDSLFQPGDCKFLHRFCVSIYYKKKRKKKSALIVCQAVWILVMIISHKYRTYGVLTSSKVAKVVVFFLACKLFTSHVNQLITPSIVIISQVVPLEQISTLYQKSAT